MADPVIHISLTDFFSYIPLFHPTESTHALSRRVFRVCMVGILKVSLILEQRENVTVLFSNSGKI